MFKKVIEPVQIESFEYILENIDEYVERFSTDAVVVFRGVPISRDQQLLIMRIFGDKIGWFPNSSSKMSHFWSYEENHQYTMDLYNKHNVGKNEIFIPWHLEHIGHKNPAIGATWNMEKFTCERGLGNTLFVNVADVYEMFADDEIEFLKQSDVAAFYGWSADESAPQTEPTIYPAVQRHKPSGRYGLRLSPMLNVEEFFYLHSLGGRKPTEEEKYRFVQLSDKFARIVCENQDLQQVHIWEQYDLVVVDLFMMAHAVLGGFKSVDRFFHGYWAHAKESSKYDAVG